MKKKIILIFGIMLLLASCSRIQGIVMGPKQKTVTPEGTSTVDMGSPRNTAIAENDNGTPAATRISPTFTPYVTAVPTAESTQGTVTIWHSFGEAQMNVFDQILKDFSDQYPDVLFDVLYIPQENMLQRYQIAVQEGNPPDLLFGLSEWGPVLSDAASIADLSDALNGDMLASINPSALAASRYKNALIGLPYAQQGVVLYRNKALANRSPATFDELVSLAKSITQGEVIGADLEQGLFYSGGHLQGLGGKLMNDDGTPAFNNDTGIAWLELIKAFGQAGPTEYQSDRDLDLFKEGRVGWIIDGTWNLSDLSTALGSDNLAIDPWPSYRGNNLAGYLQPAEIYLSAQTQYQDRAAALKFMDYVLSNEAQSKLVDGGLIPAVSSVKISDPRQDILMRQIFTALAGDVPYPTNPAMQEYKAPLDAALQSFLSGKVPAADALATAERLIQAKLQQSEPTATPSP